MLRRTAARAFAPAPERRGTTVDPGAPVDRVQAMRRTFDELRHALAEALRRQRIASKRETPLLSAGGARRAESDDGIGEARSLVEGVEFEVRTPRGKLRFRDSLDGLVHVLVAEGDGFREIEILGVQKEGSQYRLFLRRAVLDRTGFEFTSVPALVARYVGSGHSESEDDRRGSGLTRS